MAGVHLHDLTGRDRPVELVGFAGRVLDHQGCRVYSLAIPHSLPLFGWLLRDLFPFFVCRCVCLVELLFRVGVVKGSDGKLQEEGMQKFKMGLYRHHPPTFFPLFFLFLFF